MCQVRFIGCIHFGPKSLSKMRGFQDEFYHDEKIVDMWNRTVHRKDLTYILGDVTMETSEHYYQLDRLNGRKIVVLGNHDLVRDVRELLKYVENVAGMIDYKGFALTHAPIHPNEVHFYRGNIHAHIHQNLLHEVEIADKYNDNDSVIRPTKNKYYCVDAARLEYKPRTIEELLK
jgi:calcineurin-like phosphoesterase family protein